VADVYFGKVGAGGKKGRLLGNRNRKPFSKPIDFSLQIGVYALYADFDLVYVGQVGGGGSNRLLNRLRDHNKKLAGRWNRFSWFGLVACWGMASFPKKMLPSIPLGRRCSITLKNHSPIRGTSAERSGGSIRDELERLRSGS